MIGIMDRFEGDTVVVELDGEMQDFLKKIFPKNAETGDVVEISDDKVTVLKRETEELRKEIEQLVEDV